MLGKSVVEIVSGFTGIAVVRTEFMNGNVQYTVTAPVKDDKVTDLTFDAHVLELVRGGREVPVLTPEAEAVPLLGCKVVDPITGYEGVAIRRCVFCNGCIYYVVAGKYDPNAKDHERFFETSRLKVLDHKPVHSGKRSGTGGPAFAPGQRT